MVLEILFWIIWLLWPIGFFVDASPSPAPAKMRGWVVWVLLGILGIKLFGNFLNK